MKRQQRVAVAGGGMGGLAVGLLLQRAGYDATIYEQADELLAKYDRSGLELPR